MVSRLDRSASRICADLTLDDAARELLRDEMRGREFLDLLAEHDLVSDAIKVLARALPKATAVEWACNIARSEFGDRLHARDRTCLDAAERWIADPSDVNRRAALAAAGQRDYATPSAWLAAAAGWSAGSLTAPHEPPVPPADHLTAQAVAGALTVLASRKPPEFVERQTAYLRAGLETT